MRARHPTHGHDHGAVGTYAIPPPPMSGVSEKKSSRPPPHQPGTRDVNELIKASERKTVRAPYKSIRSEVKGSHYSPKYGR